MSFVKYRVKEVAADFGMAPKEIADIVGKFGEKPKSNTQVLTDAELNCVFDYMTKNHQISSPRAVSSKLRRGWAGLGRMDRAGRNTTRPVSI